MDIGFSLSNRTVNDWQRDSDLLRDAPCGVIEVADERFVRVRLRRCARRASWVETLLDQRLTHHWRAGNRCWLYYHQPRRHADYLALDYVVSTHGTSLATFRGTLRLLDEIARLKRSDALLCDVAQARISDRLLARWGWAPHAPSRWHRHFIKRFYGRYPASDRLLATLLGGQEPLPAQLALCR